MNSSYSGLLRIESERRRPKTPGVIVWLRRIRFAVGMAWRHRGHYHMVRWHDARAGHDVIEFVVDSTSPVAPTPKGVGLVPSQRNRGGRG